MNKFNIGDMVKILAFNGNDEYKNKIFMVSEILKNGEMYELQGNKYAWYSSDLERYIYEETEATKEYNESKSELECYIQNSIGKFEDTLRNMIKKYDVKKVYDLKFKIQLIPLIEMESEKEGNKWNGNLED